MKDLKHLIYFEGLLENQDNELVKQAHSVLILLTYSTARKSTNVNRKSQIITNFARKKQQANGKRQGRHPSERP